MLVEAAVDGRRSSAPCSRASTAAPPDASVPGEVVVDGGAEFYDFEAKYLDAGTRHGDPARRSRPRPSREIRRLACAAFDAMSCEGLARVDFFYTPTARS